MTGFLKLYGVSLATALDLDALWLGFVARSFYREQLGDLLRPDPRWSATVSATVGSVGYLSAAVLGS